MRKYLKKHGRKILLKFYPQLGLTSALPHLLSMANSVSSMKPISSTFTDSVISEHAKCSDPCSISQSQVGSYTYIAINSIISGTEIGKFCSIGPNFICGWGIHPTNGISTSPMFYSTLKQNGISLSKTNKIVERKKIIIENDVYIGANVTVLDGVTIGNGAVIGAGAVVSKDIPPYSIAIGCPIKILKYRFESDQIDELLQIKWWDFDENKLKDVESMFFDVDEFIKKYRS